MSQPELFTPSDSIGPNDDAWLLPDGTIYPCAPDQHDACAAWLSENVLQLENKDFDWKSKINENSPARAKVQYAGAAMVRGAKILRIGQDELALSLPQIEAAKANGLAYFDVNVGQVFSGEAYEASSQLLADRAAEVIKTDAYARHIAEENLEFFMESRLGSDFDPATYTPGMFKPNFFSGDGPLATTESFAHFQRAPLSKSNYLYIGYTSPPSHEEGENPYELEDVTYDTLSQGYETGFTVNDHSKYLSQERTVSRADVRLRYLPAVDGHMLEVVMIHYVHDGLSADMVWDWRQTTIRANLVTRESMNETIAKYKARAAAPPKDHAASVTSRGTVRRWSEITFEDGRDD